MHATSSRHFSAALNRLAEIRQFVQGSAAALGADPAAISDLLLAVDEAATNVIVYGYRDRPGEIEIEVGRQGSALVIRLRDQAPPFDPTAVPPPDLDRPLEERAPGGLGIYLMRQAVDEVIHRTTPQGGNELTLVKRGGKGESHDDD
jgi:serine/threonine-protein kinase RsbW